eukprot:COSAG06_NODE_159_length_21747_cov_5.504111_11_plen_111_part_00
MSSWQASAETESWLALLVTMMHVPRMRANGVMAALSLTFADEDVAKDPERSLRRGDVNTCHAEEADHVLVLDDVVVRRELEDAATEGHLDVGKLCHVLARDGVCKGSAAP